MIYITNLFIYLSESDTFCQCKILRLIYVLEIVSFCSVLRFSFFDLVARHQRQVLLSYIGTNIIQRLKPSLLLT
jgi:hypothetical protein